MKNLHRKKIFGRLPETFIIFITEKDFFGLGKPIYLIERVNLVSGETFNDGEHILYINGEYRDDSEIGKLMHDFCCTDAAEMNFQLMAERTRYLKEDPKGVSEMCKVIEDMRREEREEGKREGVRTVVLRMLSNTKLDLETIAECAELPLEEVQKLRIELNA